jgi:nitrite reductase/ring-hydroxylating ferredoxin subunit
MVAMIVCPAEELGPGEIIGTRVGDDPVVVLRTADGELHALLDRCVHQGARLSGGRLVPRVESAAPGEYRACGQLLKCPWHGYEYDPATGCVAFDSRRRVRRFAAREEDGNVVVARSSS